MIKTLPKPFRGIQRPQIERLPKRNRMTLAIGMQCKNGLLIGADTRISYYGEPISEGMKLTGFDSPSGTYVIAQSSEDVHAAHTLMGEIQANIQACDPKTFRALESAVKDVMGAWYAPVYDNRPIVRLLLGVCLQQETEKGLYFCEPPNTASRVYENYKAIGEGRSISDPIYDAWFKGGSPWPRHASICQLSYLMYKAKQLLPASIGGHTDVALLTEPLTVPYWITQLSMECAESWGVSFDRGLSKLVSSAIAGNQGGTEEIMTMAQGIYQSSLTYSRLEFHCQFPDETIRHEF